MRSFIFLILLITSSFSSIAQKKKPDVNKIGIQWEVIENNHQGSSQFLSAFTISNKSSQALPATGWSVYFNFVRAIKPETVSGNVRIEHINGDLFRLTPSIDFEVLSPGQTLRIEFVSSDWVVNFTDAPAGLYLVWDDKPEVGVTIENYSIIPSTEPRQYLRSENDKIGLVTHEKLFEQNKSITDLEDNVLIKIFPSPASYKEGSGLFMITESTTIDADPDFAKEADYLATELSWVIGKKLSRSSRNQDSRNKIFLIKGNTPESGYTLNVSPARVEITAASSAGVFYGIQSLKTLIPSNNLKVLQRYVAIPSVEVMDEPRFGHRAFFLDVARNYQTKYQLLKLIDLMALYKLNVLHLHFNDDEGWRLEIPGLPELTAVGSRRGHTLTNNEFLQPSFGSGPDVNNPYGSGYYTRLDFIEILKYAKNRHVKIIPEIETPGHARAAVKAMQARYERLMKEGKTAEAAEFLLYHPEDRSEYRSVQGWTDNIMDVGLPSTYVFLEKVVDEIQSMYKEADAPLETIHFGGDEVPAGVWEKSPSCAAVIEEHPHIKSAGDLWYYFFNKVSELVKSKGLYLYGWEEISMRKTSLDGNSLYIPNPDFVRKGFQVDVWNNVLGWGAEDLAYKLANAGYKVVLSCVSHLYFDMAYYKAFDEPGYYWGAFVDLDKPFGFIPYDYFKNTAEDRLGNPLDRKIFIGKERLTEYGKQNIIGIQGLLWSENMLGAERMEYQILPKMFGLAERAWAQDPTWATEKDSAKSQQLYKESWSHFVNVIGKRELPRLDYYHDGYKYRIPTPGAVIEDGKVLVNIQFPGLTIRYTTDGKEPGLKSKIYEGPIATKGKIKVKAFSSTGRSGRTMEIINP